ncbi:hypothetical protein PIB30_070447 [Stylosanthes scabra]|uniref:CUE domain-containing protein n=1 Tax=Stylosanthes scabra TaxID=79078 RepID=A0ABU6YL32_9FABA|nr:hypothetical protein [Stylosanthes scabra]
MECWKGSMTISDHFEQIPCKIMLLCYDKDCKEFGSQNMEFVFADDLFPENLPIVERTNHWMHMFSLFTFRHEKALITILTQKRRLQSEMKNYLAMRKKLKVKLPPCLVYYSHLTPSVWSNLVMRGPRISHQPEHATKNGYLISKGGVDSEDEHKNIENILVAMAEYFPDCHKAEEGLRSLNLTKDNKLFKSIEQLLEKQTFTVRQANRSVEGEHENNLSVVEMRTLRDG